VRSGCGVVGREWRILAPDDHHSSCLHHDHRGYHDAINDSAWYQHQFNLAYDLYERGWLHDHDLPRLRPQHCRCHNHDHGGADIDHQHDDSARHDYERRRFASDYVHVRRADYDNLVAAVNVNVDNYYAVDLLNAARILVNHVNDDAP
jgi:hypothetical protein